MQTEMGSVGRLLEYMRLRDKAVKANLGFQVMQAEALIADTAKTVRERVFNFAFQALAANRRSRQYSDKTPEQLNREEAALSAAGMDV